MNNLLELAAEWQRIDDAANPPLLTDDERTERLDGQEPTVRAIISTPASTMEELAAKIQIYCAAYEIEETDGIYERVLVSALQDAERMAVVDFILKR